LVCATSDDMLSLPLKGDIQLVGPEAIGDGEDLKISIAFWEVQTEGEVDCEALRIRTVRRTEVQSGDCLRAPAH